MKKYLCSSAVILALLIGNSFNACAQSELTLISPGSAKSALDQLLSAFERETGHKVKATLGTGIGTKKIVIEGGAFDVSIVPPPLAEVIASGNVVPNTETPLATVAVGIAVRKGTPKPDISTPEALRQTLLAVKSITYPEPSSGAGVGISFEETLKRLGIVEQVRSKLKSPQGYPGGAFAMVAKGDVEMVVRYTSEMTDPDLGIDVVGALPSEISPPAGLVGFISSHSKEPAAAKALLDYLSSPAAAAVYESQSMKPGR